MVLDKVRPLAPFSVHAARAAQKAARDGAWNCDLPGSLEEVDAGVAICRRCQLSQVGGCRAGQGPPNAAMMLVGEVPIDDGDSVAPPPAVRVLAAGLRKAEIPRERVFLTHALRRDAGRPTPGRPGRAPPTVALGACRWWLDAERRLVRPKVVVALGRTAAASVFGRAAPICDRRGVPAPLPDRGMGLVTFNPADLPRLPGDAAKREAFALFVADLKLAARLGG